jgi:hypothetical protein
VATLIQDRAKEKKDKGKGKVEPIKPKIEAIEDSQ